MSGKQARTAREQARSMASRGKQHQAKGPVRHLKWGIPALAVAGVAVYSAVAFASASNEFPASGPVPATGNIHGGITHLAQPAAKNLTVDTEKDIPATEGLPAGIKAAGKDEPVQVVEYIDLNCVHCADFSDTYGADLKILADRGDITLETRTVAFLDGGSPTNYSSRAANAAACVADAAPEKHQDFLTAVLSGYEDGEKKNQQLIDTAAGIGVTGIDECVAKGTFRPFVKHATMAAEAHGVTGTPSVYINGEVWEQGDVLSLIHHARS